jgi:hypothetical protein
VKFHIQYIESELPSRFFVLCSFIRSVKKCGVNISALWWMTCMKPTSIVDYCDKRDFYFLFIVSDLYAGRTVVCIFFVKV